MDLVKVISAEISELKRKIKFLRGGKSDVQTAPEAMPFGYDSHPVKDWIAVYSKTSQNGKGVVIGYINKQQLAEVGETRLFSTDADGALQTYIWLTNDGKIELGGSDNFAVKFNELKEEFNDLKGSVNDLVQSYNTHTHTTACGAGAGSASPTPTQAVANSANIDNAKNENILTN